jgi:uroporphyrinogen decarboxylase
VDRVPFCFWHHSKPHGSAQRLARFTLDFFGGFDLDIFKIMPDIPYPLARDFIHTADDWAYVTRLDPYEGNLGRMVQTVAIMRERLVDEAPLITTVFSPFTYAYRAAGGADKLRVHIQENPVQLHAALGVMAQNIADFCQACLDAGADGIFFAAQGAGDNMATPAEYAEFARPYELMALQGAQDGWLTTLHVHASAGLDITPFLDYPAPVLSWSDRLTGISLKEVRAKAPDKCLMGGISEAGPITKGPKEAIAAEMRDALAQAGERRFILANGCSVPDDNPEQWLRAAREALDEITKK